MKEFSQYDEDMLVDSLHNSLEIKSLPPTIWTKFLAIAKDFTSSLLQWILRDILMSPAGQINEFYIELLKRYNWKDYTNVAL